MKTRYFLLFFGFGLRLYGQVEDIKLDLLKAPASPAANLLNMTPEQISHASDVNALMTQLGKQTTNFTQLPKSFAIDFAPRWMINKNVKNNNFTQKSYLLGKATKTTFDVKAKDNFTTIPQTFVLSFAYQDSTDVTYDFSPRPSRIATGFRFSIVRGELKNLKKEIETYKAEVKMLKGMKKDLKLLHSQKQLKLQDLNIVNEDNIVEAFGSTLVRTAVLENQIKNTLVGREGMFWDMAGGYVWDAFTKPSSEIKNNKWALWSTFGYESFMDKKKLEGSEQTSYSSFVVMGMLRVQQSRDSLIFGKISDKYNRNYDAGLKLNFTQVIPRSISVNLEALYRKVDKNSLFDSSWRLAFGADYEVSSNMKLTLSLGRDFAGVVTKEGNLFGLLGFAAGFGSKRQLEE